MDIFYTDGSTFNNGQVGNQLSRVVVTDGQGNVLIDQEIGDRTIIETEGIAITAALRYCIDRGIKNPKICSDSEFWVKAINFAWKLKKQHLFPIRDRLNKYVFETSATLQWVPREQSLAGRFIEGKGFPVVKKIVCPHCGKAISI